MFNKGQMIYTFLFNTSYISAPRFSLPSTLENDISSDWSSHSLIIQWAVTARYEVIIFEIHLSKVSEMWPGHSYHKTSDINCKIFAITHLQLFHKLSLDLSCLFQDTFGHLCVVWYISVFYYYLNPCLFSVRAEPYVRVNKYMNLIFYMKSAKTLEHWLVDAYVSTLK